MSTRTEELGWPGESRFPWGGDPGGPLGGVLLGGGSFSPVPAYPSQAAARKAAQVEAGRQGTGARVRHELRRGELPRYVVETLIPVGGPFSYPVPGTRQHRTGQEAEQELEAALSRIDRMVGVPSPLLRIFTEPLHGAGRDEHARLMAMLERRGVDPKQAGYTYQGLVARDLGDVTAQGLLNAGRTPWDVGNRHEVTLEGRSSPFGARKLAQLGALLRASGTLNLTVPRLSDPAQRQLRGLLTGLSRRQPRRHYGLIVRQTFPPAGR